MSCPALGTEHECPKIGTEEECLIGGQMCSYVANRFLAEVEIHMRRAVPTRCEKFTTEGDIPEGYPHACCNCSYVGDKENCPYEPIIHIDTYKIGDEHDEWTVSHILGRQAPLTVIPEDST